MSWLKSLLALALFSVTALPQEAAGEPSAAEIMAASKAAMSKPLKFRIIMNGIEMVVYQKMLPDGSVASVADISSPIKKTIITYGDKCYELYLDRHLAIDMGFAYKTIKNQTGSIVSLLGGKEAASPRLIGTTELDGKECYQIESVITPDGATSIAKVLPTGINGAMPTKFRHLIEKNTYLMVEQEIIMQDGSSTKTEFRDVKPQPDLSDDFFQLPSGFDVKTPKSVTDYVMLASGIRKIARREPTFISPEGPAFLPRQRPLESRPGAHATNAVVRPQLMNFTNTTIVVCASAVFCALVAAFVVQRLRARCFTFHVEEELQ